MRRLFTALFVAALLALGAVRADATTRKRVDVTCPVCAHAFQAWEIRSYTTGAPDFDFCPKIRGEQVLPYQLWTCPACRYSAWCGETFQKGVKPETAEKIRAGLEPLAPIAADAEQMAIPAWVKFDLAVRVLEMDGAPTMSVRIFLLNAAWATRVESERIVAPLWRDADFSKALEAAYARAEEREKALATDLPGGFAETDREITAARALLASKAPEGATPEAAAERLLDECAAAYVLRFRGEIAEAEDAIARLLAREDLPGAFRDPARGLLESIPRERAFLERFCALPSAEKAGDGEEAEKELLFWTWQQADERRRLGRFDEARDGYLAVLGDPATPPHLALLARRLLREGPTAAPPEALAAAWKATEERALQRFLNPETVDKALQELRQAPIPGLAERAAAGLTSPAPAVRMAAARLAEIQDSATPERIEVLEKLFLGDPEGAVREAAGNALLAFAAPRSLEAFAKAAPTGDRHVRHHGIEGLGLVGDARSVPVLLGKAAQESDECLPALQRLANRSFTSVLADPDPDELGVSFEEWWKENRGRPRHAWVEDGFRSIGKPVDLSDRKAAIPLLIDLLGDRRDWIRVNALRELRALTGRSAGWFELREKDESPRDGKAMVAKWRRWWKEQGSK